MEQSWEHLPKHLNRYISNQEYSRYSPEDQAVWRFIMKGLKRHLSVYAHPCYLNGLEKTGISDEEIPQIAQMDLKLREFGWGAVPVSGFIPPAAFMEFQSMGILPIACDMRTREHLLYTPAPDIVHEAAGHAPILIDPDFAGYLKHYGEVARHAIISRLDLDQYQAIRNLSDIKEHPDSSAEQIALANEKLNSINSQIKDVSEAGLLSRMNWWTAEYGLIGDLKSPKIFGAGLLSSLGEARSCLNPEVKKLPLTVDCVNYSYDITERQPQLFVTPDFASLYRVLDELAERMSFKRGGVFGLNQALKAESVNTVVLDSGVQISGQLREFLSLDPKPSDSSQVFYLSFSGPCQLSFERQQIKGHGREQHPQGFGTPLGAIKGLPKPLFQCTPQELSGIGLRQGEHVQLEFESGVDLRGRLRDLTFAKGHLILLSFVDCEVKKGGRVLFQPDWGTFDMAVGDKVVSVFGGPADREEYELDSDFVNARVPLKKTSAELSRQEAFYLQIRRIRENKNSKDAQPLIEKLSEEFFHQFSANWLMGFELLELSESMNNSPQVEGLRTHMESLRHQVDPEIYAILTSRRTG